ncbi:hypothetical protein [Actinoplanes sp. NPDC051494]|uniref:hypothetical protein n=1 Tax=Actinoplanes sp. NPDC051494 TaxID=3363907 RepID=UPI0037897ACA
MPFPVFESRADDARPLRRMAESPSSERVARRFELRPTWHLVIFPIACAALVRAVLHLGGQAAEPWLTCLLYALAVAVGIGLAVAVDVLPDPEVARAISAVLGSVAFAISSYSSADLSGACVLLAVYLLLAVITRRTSGGRP